VVPVVLKIVLVFTIFILVSNLTTNYINLIYTRTKMISLTRELLAKDLKDIYVYSNNQYEIYKFNNDLKGSMESIEKKGLNEFTKKKSVLLGIKPDGSFLFQSFNGEKSEALKDKKTLAKLNADFEKKTQEGVIQFTYNGESYFGIYKYNPKWEAYIVRAEEENEFLSESRQVFRNVSVIILLITIISSVVGIYVLRFILRYIQIITSEIREMIDSQQLKMLDLKGAPNDDITFMGIAFNSLSSTINNLLNIFRKFANKDVVLKAYEEREVRLEGTQRELTVLFSDIKSFTFITETLGADIIKLLNMHYDNAIREIVDHDGIIGSIIGDALLAVFGAMDVFEGIHKNKSMQSVVTAYKLQDLAQDLRQEMIRKKQQIERKKGRLTAEEDKVYQACLLEIGVGIDGGLVFYGNIGSYVRMTNTVIGDNVNASSRLEGLTRVYKVPVICSDYVKDDIENNVHNHGITFLELDMVKVKGKTEGKKVYWPVPRGYMTKGMAQDFKVFNKGLEYYYNGDWRKAYSHFNKCKLPLAAVFKERTKDNKAPKNWNGIWEMKTK